MAEQQDDSPEREPSPSERAIEEAEQEARELDMRAEDPRGLTAFEARFVRHYLVTRNATKSAKLAGSRAEDPAVLKVIGYRVRNRPRVARAIDEYDARADDLTKASRAWVLDKVQENVDLAMESGDRMAANRGLELLMKHLGMVSDRLDVRLQGAVQELLDLVEPHMKPESYAELIRALAKAHGVDAVDPVEAAQDRGIH